MTPLLSALLLTGAALGADVQAPDGTIAGVVVKAPDQMAVPRAEVVLRAKIDNEWTVLAETKTDAAGRFGFQKIPLDAPRIYQVGANRDGVHYPAAPVRLDGSQPQAKVGIVVYDAVKSPCPLVVRRHDIELRSEPGCLRVTESLLVDNPTSLTYVGQSESEGGEPVTLRLSIPCDFDRTTFASEFFGRRFSLADGKLVTGIPWTPGRRELKFTYTLPHNRPHLAWKRPLDLPSSLVSVRVGTQQTNQVRCSLGTPSEVQADSLQFAETERTLPAGHVLEVELGKLPFSLTAYAPWLALAVLVVAVGVVAVRLARQPRARVSVGPKGAAPSGRHGVPPPHQPRRKRSAGSTRGKTG